MTPKIASVTASTLPTNWLSTNPLELAAWAAPLGSTPGSGLPRLASPPINDSSPARGRAHIPMRVKPEIFCGGTLGSFSPDDPWQIALGAIHTPPNMRTLQDPDVVSQVCCCQILRTQKSSLPWRTA